jgi:hypothetical protein
MEQVLQSFGQNGWELGSVIDETIDPSRQNGSLNVPVVFQTPFE